MRRANDCMFKLKFTIRKLTQFKVLASSGASTSRCSPRSPSTSRRRRYQPNPACRSRQVALVAPKLIPAHKCEESKRLHVPFKVKINVGSFTSVPFHCLVSTLPPIRSISKRYDILSISTLKLLQLYLILTPRILVTLHGPPLFPLVIVRPLDSDGR